MALVFATGFENGSLYGLPGVDYSSASLSITEVRTGIYSLTLGTVVGNYKVDISPTATIISGVYFRPNSLNLGRLRFYTTSEGTILDVRHGIDGKFYAYVNNSLVGTSSSAFAAGQWVHLEVKITIDDIAGVFQVKVNGHLEINYSGDTKPATATTIDRVEIYQTGRTFWDDFWIDDANLQGDLRFVALTPNGDTATKDWTPSTGATNYNLVDEIPPSDLDYVYTATNGIQDLYTFTDFDSTGLTPNVLVQWGRGLTETADGQGLKLLLYSGTTLSTGSTNSLHLDARNFFEIYETDPDTGLAWTDSAIDAIQAGQEAVIP